MCIAKQMIRQNEKWILEIESGPAQSDARVPISESAKAILQSSLKNPPLPLHLFTES